MNVSNVIAACFTATGQPIASVPESSIAQTEVELNKSGVGGIHVSTFLPSLNISGDETTLTPTQAECLDIMGCIGANKVAKFAEIIATFCLALDISTASAIANGSFALAHESLGRNRPHNDE